MHALWLDAVVHHLPRVWCTAGVGAGAGAKTEVMWCTTERRQHQLPTAALPIDGVPVAPVTSVDDLGIYLHVH